MTAEEKDMRENIFQGPWQEPDNMPSLRRHRTKPGRQDVQKIHCVTRRIRSSDFN